MNAVSLSGSLPFPPSAAPDFRAEAAAVGYTEARSFRRSLSFFNIASLHSHCCSSVGGTGYPASGIQGFLVSLACAKHDNRIGRRANAPRFEHEGR